MNRLSEIEAMYVLMSEEGQLYLHGMARQLVRSFPQKKNLKLLPSTQERDQIHLLNDDAHGAVYQFPLVGIR